MIDLSHIITSILLGIIEGITEFLPISSTGHIIIAKHWLGIENDRNTKILDIFIQLGSACAILYFFRIKIIKILTLAIDIRNQKTNVMHIFFAILPTSLLGFIFYKDIKLFFNVNKVMYTLTLGSVFLIFSEIFKPKKYKTLDLNKISFSQSIIIGLFQIFCLFPGFSRSGMTIGSGILLGIEKSVAIDFSFIISIPLLIGSSLYDLINNFSDVKILELPRFFIGSIISFIISIICIKKLLQIINRISLIFFGIYRFMISLLIYFVN